MNMKVQVQVDNSTLSQFVAQVWKCLPPSERKHNWTTAASSDKKRKIIKFAENILNER